jgi:hypothetical protein
MKLYGALEYISSRIEIQTPCRSVCPLVYVQSVLLKSHELCKSDRDKQKDLGGGPTCCDRKMTEKKKKEEIPVQFFAQA